MSLEVDVASIRGDNTFLHWLYRCSPLLEIKREAFLLSISARPEAGLDGFLALEFLTQRRAQRVRAHQLNLSDRLLSLPLTIPMADGDYYAPQSVQNALACYVWRQVADNPPSPEGRIEITPCESNLNPPGC